jgi:transcription termination/antitermination protein NusG
VRPKFAFEVGDMVRIKSGAFQSFTGKVEEVDHNAWKLKVRVSVFDRYKSIELKFLDVEKLTFTEKNEE